MNLEIPLAAIYDERIAVKLLNVKTKVKIGRLSGHPLADPELYNKLTAFPAHSEMLLIDGYVFGEEIKEGFYDTKSDQFMYQVTVDTEVYFQGSKQPIGYYKDGKFEKKIFQLKSQVIINKQRGLRLGRVLKMRDRPVTVY